MFTGVDAAGAGVGMGGGFGGPLFTRAQRASTSTVVGAVFVEVGGGEGLGRLACGLGDPLLGSKKKKRLTPPQCVSFSFASLPLLQP